MQISKGTIVRTIVLALALFNQIMLNIGKPIIDIDEGTIDTLVNSLITVGTALLCWWKNNSFTQNALHADSYKEMLDNAEKISRTFDEGSDYNE